MADAIQEQTPPSTGPATYQQDGISIESNTASVATLKEAFSESSETATEEPPAAEAPIPPSDPRERNDDGTFKPQDKPKPAKPRDDPNARISQAVGRQREAERRADAAEQRAREHEAELHRLRTPPAQAPVAESFVDPSDPEPNPDDLTKYPDGQFDRAYYKHQAQWEARQLIKQNEYRAEQGRRAAAQQQEETTRQRTVSERAAKFSERISAVVEADPDFLDKVHPRLLEAKPLSALTGPERQHATFANFLADQVFRSDHPKDLLLYLSNEPEVQRLATLPPEDVIRDLATFEARLDAAPLRGSAPAPKISHAKAPIQPLGSSPHTPDPTELTDDLDMDEFIRRGNALDRKAGRL